MKSKPTHPTPLLAAAVSTRLRSGARWAEHRFPRVGRAIIAPILMSIPRVREDRLGVEAGSITYGAFLALPPLLLLVAAGASLIFANDPQAQQALIDSVEEMVPGLEQTITNQLHIHRVGQFGTGFVGIISLAWAASGFAARARIALGAIFRGPPTGLIAGRVWAALVGVPVFIAIVLVTVATGILDSLNVSGTMAVIVRVGFSLAVFIASIAFFLVVYWALTPRGLVKFRQHLPGALVFSLTWAVLSRVGNAFVAFIAGRSTALYGVIGALFGVLAFIYAVMWCFLLAAEFTQASKELGDPSGSERSLRST